MMVYFTLNHYRKIDANRMEDPMKDVLSTVLPHYPFLVPYAERLVTEPEENKRYLQWLKEYLSSILGETVYNVTVHERLVHFTHGRQGRGNTATEFYIPYSNGRTNLQGNCK
jgi:hypothetical protein